VPRQATVSPQPNWNDDVYYQGMAAAGAAKYMDCVGIHYNEGIVAPNATSGDSRDNYPTRYFSTMMARALGPFGGHQGLLHRDRLPDSAGLQRAAKRFAWAQNTTLAQQAQWILRRRCWPRRVAIFA